MPRPARHRQHRRGRPQGNADLPPSERYAVSPQAGKPIRGRADERMPQ